MKNKSVTSHSVSRLLRILCLLLLLPLLASCQATAVRDGEDETNEEDVAASGRPTKRVALTFDDGPHNVRTPAIVDELNKYGYHATFFVVGNRVDGSAYNGGDAMLYAIEAGNEIGIHGYTHEVYYDKCSGEDYANEMNLTKKAIRGEEKGYKIQLMRPVGGRITRTRLEDCPYSVIGWDVDSEDWRYKYSSSDSEEDCREKVDTIVERVLEDVEDGSIILMHDIYESTYDAVVIILERLHEMGYDVVTVSELLGDTREAGERYGKTLSVK